MKNIIDSCKKADSELAALDNILWSYYMLTKQYGEAEKIWNSSVINGPRNISFGKIVDVAREDKDLTMSEKLVQFLKQKQDIFPRALGHAYGALIDILG